LPHFTQTQQQAGSGYDERTPCWNVSVATTSREARSIGASSSMDVIRSRTMRGSTAPFSLETSTFRKLCASQCFSAGCGMFQSEWWLPDPLIALRICRFSKGNRISTARRKNAEGDE
jgi:hypothetical protein